MITYKRIFVGSRCNNNCLYCNEKNGSRNPELSDIVAKIAHNGGLDSVEFYGGDPTLRSDLFSILDAARNQAFKRIKIVTNARALADIDAAVKTVESGCYFFEVKVHHHQPDIHDYVTQVKGSLQQTVEGIRNLRRINNLNQTPFSAFISLRIAAYSGCHQPLYPEQSMDPYTKNSSLRHDGLRTPCVRNISCT